MAERHASSKPAARTLEAGDRDLGRFGDLWVGANAGCSERFPAGWWLLPALVLGLASWVGIFWLLIGWLS